MSQGAASNSSSLLVVADYQTPALDSLKEKLYVGEEVRWVGEQSTPFMLIDLCYKGVFMWLMFGFILPDATVLSLTFVLMMMVCYLDFRKTFHGRVYVLTDQRAFYCERLRNGSWKSTDYNLNQLVSFKRKPMLKILVLKFRGAHGMVKNLQFLYLANSDSAMTLLLPHAAVK